MRKFLKVILLVVFIASVSNIGFCNEGTTPAPAACDSWLGKLFNACNENPELTKAIKENPALIDSFKKLDDAGINDVIKNNPNNLKIIDGIEGKISSSNLSDALKNTGNPQKLINDLGKTDNFYSGSSGIEITVSSDANKIRIQRKKLDSDASDIANVKTKYGAGKTKNTATGKGSIGGDDIDLETISGKVTPQNQAQKGNFTPPEEQHYHGVLEYENHTEQKIVEYLRGKYKNDFDVEGVIEIVSERKFCDNCVDIVDQFQVEFPNITVIRVEVLP